MGMQIIGQSGELLAVDAKYRALRSSLRPLDVGANGGYRMTALSGSITATLAAASILFALRWGDATKKLVLHEINVGVLVDGTITTAVSQMIEAVVARAYTASHTGGTALLPSGNVGKTRTTMASSAVTDARMATTAALGGGTVTADAQAIGLAFGPSGTTAPQAPIAMQSIYKPHPGAEHPVVLDQNEGLLIRNVLTGPVTGTFRLAVMLAWSEVDSYSNAGL